jgi:RNA polymerase sigma factor (TIGR02999 family)
VTQSSTAPGEITQWLAAWRAGDADAVQRLMPVVHEALRTIASRHMRHETEGHTLTPTALVHEAWLRLMDQHGMQFTDRTHFLAIASRVMRHVLVDHARRAQADKRSPPLALATDLSTASPDAWALTMIAIDDAMERLAIVDARLARVVECRFFSGLTDEETATILGVTARTVHRDWVRARAWLEMELRD